MMTGPASNFSATLLDAVIEQAAQIILAASPRGTRVILFGSRARRSNRPDSDVDFLVIQPGEPARMMEAARLARVIRHTKLPADVIVVSEQAFEQWKNVGGSVYNEANRDGKVFR